MEPTAYPLSYPQEELWLQEEAYPGLAAANLLVAVEFAGPLDAEWLERCLNDLIQRHEILRSTYDSIDGTPCQRVQPHHEMTLEVETLAPGPREQQWEDLGARAGALKRLPFDLRAAPPLRARLFRLDEQDHVLVFVLHHIAADVASIQVLLRETAALYAAPSRNGDAPPLEPATPYRDYAVWQRNRFGGGTLDRLVSFWKRQLDGISVAESGNLAGSASVTVRPLQRSLVLDSTALAALRVVSARERSTLFMLFLLALTIVLHKRTGRTDLLVAVTIANRRLKAHETMMGPCANIVALRIDLSGDPIVRDVLRRIRRASTDALAHGELPLTLLLERVFPELLQGGAPPCQASVNMTLAIERHAILPGLTMRAVGVGAAQAVSRRFLHVSAIEGKGRLFASLESDSDVWSETALQEIAGEIACVLTGLEDSLERRLSACG